MLLPSAMLFASSVSNLFCLFVCDSFSYFSSSKCNAPSRLQADFFPSRVGFSKKKKRRKNNNKTGKAKQKNETVNSAQNENKRVEGKKIEGKQKKKMSRKNKLEVRKIMLTFFLFHFAAFDFAHGAPSLYAVSRQQRSNRVCVCVYNFFRCNFHIHIDSGLNACCLRETGHLSARPRPADSALPTNKYSNLVVELQINMATIG